MNPGTTSDLAKRLLEVFANLLGGVFDKTVNSTGSRIFFTLCFSTFGMFVITFFWQEVRIVLWSVLPRNDSVSGSPVYICAGGSYEMYFRTAVNAEHSGLYQLSTQTME